jgi:aminocyclitol acetyltransferase
MYYEHLVRGRQIVIWGAGETGYNVERYLINLKGGGAVCFADKKFLSASEYCGKPVISLELLDKDKHYVYVGSTLHKKEIEDTLIKMGFEAVVDFANVKNIDNINFNGVQYFDRIIDGRLLGKGSFIGNAFYVKLPLPVVKSVGRFSSIHETLIIQNNHDMNFTCTGGFHMWIPQHIRNQFPIYEGNGTVNSVEIGNDVWIGANVFINCTRVRKIGDGAIIGTGAIVLEDVPPYAIVFGAPGKIKKYRYTSEQIECLLRVQWWNWTDEERDEYAECLFNPQLFFNTFM